MNLLLENKNKNKVQMNSSLINHNSFIKLFNCRILRNNALSNDDLFVRYGKVIDPEQVFYEEKDTANIEIDCNGLIIAPGFIDVQLNGAFGKDFTHDKSDFSKNLDLVSVELPKYGVTSYCPTIVSSSACTYSNVISKMHARDCNTKKRPGASILGLHLEGPFLNEEKKGAHESTSIKSLPNGIISLKETYGELDKLIETCSVITLAPELDPKGDVIKYLSNNGVVVSIGHTLANFEQGLNAIKHGARFITHLFNAMAPFHHREQNLIGLLSMQDMLKSDLYYGIISDGVHTHSAAIDMAYKMHPDGMVLVTDAMSAMGLPDGSHRLGNKSVEIKKYSDSDTYVMAAYVEGTNILCGAVASMNKCVYNLIKNTECSLVQGLKCSSEHPAKLLGLFPQKGSLQYGSDADFVIVDENINVYATFTNGSLAWLKRNWNPEIKIFSNKLI